jgi:hypothetical protein
MKIHMSGQQSFMTIGFGVTSKPIGTSQSSRTGRIPSLHIYMLIGLIFHHPKPGGGAQSHGTRDSTRALPSREVRFRAVGRVAVLEPS